MISRYDLLEDHASATEWFKILHGALQRRLIPCPPRPARACSPRYPCVLSAVGAGAVPNDPRVLARLGALYDKEHDETSAFHNFSDVRPVETAIAALVSHFLPRPLCFPPVAYALAIRPRDAVVARSLDDCAAGHCA